MRIVGGQTSPTGIESGADGTFRRRMSKRSGSFSRIMTSFPANAGPPCTVDNSPRTGESRIAAGGEENKIVLERTTSDNSCANSRKGNLHSSSLPEILKVLKVRTKDSSLLESWHRSSSTSDALARRPLNEDSENACHGSNNNHGQKTESESALSALNTTPVAHLLSSPYTFRKSQTNCSSSSPNGELGSPLSLEQGSPLSRENKSKDETRRGSDVELCKGNDTSTLPSDEIARRLFFLEGYERKDISPMLYKK